MNLGDFIEQFKDAIAQRVVESYPPLYRPSGNGGKLPRLLRKPLGAQADAIRGAALSLEAHRGTTVVGEMGTGKTLLAAAAAHMAGFQRILVLGPPHLVPKWKREVEQTVPGARAVIVKSITDLERLRFSIGSGPLFAIMSREKAKLSYRWKAAVIERWAVSKGRLVRDEETGEPFRIPCCPDCTAQIVDKDGVPLTDEDLNRRKRVCANCGSPLWQADKSGPARYPLSDYVKHRMKGFFDLLVGDEVHEYKGRGSAQGIAAGVLADVCGKSLSLSGTLMGGYSSTLFHLLYRFSPELRTEFEALRRAPLDTAVRLRGGHGREGRRQRGGGRAQQPTPQVPQGGQGAAGPGSLRALPHHREHRLPPPGRRCLRAARLRPSRFCCPRWTRRRTRRATPSAAAYNTVYEELRKELADALKSWLQTAARHLPANPPGLPRRLHEGGDGLRPPERGRDRAGPAVVGGKALSQGAGPGRPGGGGADGGPPGAGLRHPHRHQGHHREDGRHPDPPRVPGGGDEGRRGGPRTAGGVGGGQGERGHRRDDLPPQAGADRPRPHRLPDPLLVRDRVLCLPIDRKRCGSRGQSIWNRLELNRCQHAAEATDVPSLADRRTGLTKALRVQVFSGGWGDSCLATK